LIVRVLLLLDDRDVAVRLKLFVKNVPFVTVTEPEQVKAPPSRHAPPIPLNTIGDAIVLPFVMMLNEEMPSAPACVAANVRVPVFVHAAKDAACRGP
jgi:hypothetical protein